jgi:hypothetical protein
LRSLADASRRRALLTCRGCCSWPQQQSTATRRKKQEESLALRVGLNFPASPILSIEGND